MLEIDPVTQQAALVALSSVVTMAVVQLVKKFIAFVPNEWLPVLAPFVGAIAASLGEISSMPGMNVFIGAIAGAAGVGFHQVWHQPTK